MKKLVILDGRSVTQKDLDWSSLDGLADYTIYDNTLPELVADRCASAQMVLTNKVQVSAGIMDRLPELKYIGVLATGYNVVDVKAAAQRGIVVTNIPAYSTESVVQMTWAHILHLCASAFETDGGVPESGICAGLLHGKTMGVVGLGNIGMRVAQVALGFGMKVLAQTSKPQQSLPGGIVSATFDRLLAESDIVSLHCPLTETNRELFSACTLQKMKPGAILINTGRGGLINEQDVAEALESGRLGGYGTDVLSTEPPRKDNPLLGAKNCSITPHIAWATVQARQRLIQICTANISAYLSGAPINVVSH